jgi:aminopeptidase N
MRIRRIGRLLALVALFQACTDAPPPPVELGVPLALAEHRAQTLSEVRYRIALDIPEDRSDPIQGNTVITFQWEDRDRHPLVVDFKDPAQRVQRVVVNESKVEWTSEADHVVIPAASLRRGENRVELAYLAGDEALNRSDEFLYTLFVPDRAHFSLPVFDQPDLKARVSWELAVPAGWVAVANGPGENQPEIPADLAGEGVHREMVEVVPSPERRTYSFRASRPIPTYLMAFAAGRFQVEMARRGRFLFTMYHRETDAAAVDRNREQIFDLHQTAVDWLEDYTGLDYPFQKFDFVLLPPFQYGGMEHPGSIFYRQSSLMLDESATQANYLGRASLIAHETAHMWFGDLVTMRWFDDVWTKEVFANFMAAKIVHPSFPEVDHKLRFLMAHHPSAYGVDRTPGANAVRQPLENLREAGTLYGAIIYQKAPVVMAHLERTVGEDTFRDGMREYLSSHLYGNATWPDLITILDRLSDEDLAAWSRVWVEEPGRPTIHVAIEDGGEEGGRVLLRQEDPWGRERIWPQSLELVASWPGGLERSTVRLHETEVVAEAWTGRERPEWVLPMGAGIEYGLFLVEGDALEALALDIQELDDPSLRGAAWLVLQDHMLEERVVPGAVLDLALAALDEERDEILVGQLLGLVGTIYWDLLPDEVRNQRAAEVEEAMWRGVTSAPTATLKASFFSAYRGVALTPGAVARLRRIWAREERVPDVPLSESQEIALVEALAVREVPGAGALLDAQFDRIQNPDRRARFEFVRPSLSADPRVREAFFESLADDANRDREPWVLSGLGYLQHPLRRAHGAGLVEAGLALVEEIQRTGDIFFPGRWLGALLGNHNSPEVVALVAEFLESRPQYPHRLRGKILQEYDGVRRAVRIVHGANSAPAWEVWP